MSGTIEDYQEKRTDLKWWIPKVTTTMLKKWMFFLITLILIAFAGFREIGLDKDSLNYSIIINSLDFSDFLKLSIIQIEPFFYLIVFIANWLFGDPVRVSFLIYALLGVSLKMIGIYRLSHIPFLSVFIYLCYYYPMHELTQIRVGVASAIFLLAVPDMVNRDFRSYFTKAMLAILFHYSAVIMIILYPLINAKKNRYFWSIVPIFGLFFVFLNKLILDFIAMSIYLLEFLPSIFSYRILLYIDLYSKGIFNEINIFNLYYFSLVAIFYFCLINIKKFKSNLDIVLIKILGLSLFTFCAFSFLPVFAQRISEFLQVAIIILLPSIVFIFKQKKLIIFVIIIYSMISIINLLFIQKQFSFG